MPSGGANRSSSLLSASRPIVETLERRLLFSANVLTYHNDVARTGASLNETTLTTGNVNSSTFGELFTYPVDGYVYAQPLYVSNLAMGGLGTHDVVFVATEHDSVYAFDADSNSGSNGQPLWHDSFINPGAGITTVPSTDTGTGDIVPEVGITGTPVIDGSTNTLYVVTNTRTVSGGNTSYRQQLHALDITTGAEKFGAPATIQFTTTGAGDGSVNGVMTFDALIQSQRPGLALNNGSVYIAWASHGDNGQYHGYLASYSAANLQFQSALNVSANGFKSGIWMGGGAPAFDSSGNVYLSVGNGTFDNNNGDWGDSFLKISSTNGALAVVDSFTPFNQHSLENFDIDFGSGGVLILPDQAGGIPHEAISGGKDGNFYLVNRDNLGGFGATSNTNLQTITTSSFDGIYDTPAYFNGAVYANPSGQGLQAYPLVNGLLTGPSSAASATFGFPGATPSISANGTINGIVWEIQYGQNAILHALDAADVSHELYNSGQAGARDQLGLGAKFAVPTVADGHVFVGTASSLAVFGLLSSGQTTPPATPSGLAGTALSATDVHLNWSETSNNAGSFQINRSSNGGAFVQVGSVAASSHNFDDLAVVVNTSYAYEVVAINSSGNSGPSNVVHVSTPAVPGLVGYWPFNEGTGLSTADASGNHASGTLSGEVTWMAGRVGPAALNFHGAGVQDAHVAIPDEAALRFGQGNSFTITAWVRANALHSKWAGIVTKSTDVAPGYGIYLDPSNHWAVATSSGVNVIEGPAADTNWHLLTLVQNGASGVRQLYVDGTLAASGASEDASGAGDLWIGGSKSSIAEYFDGGVDDLRVYNTALSQTGVQSLAEVPPTPAPGIGAITGTVYEDAAGSGINVGSDSTVNGVTVFIDLNQNGTLDPNEPSSVTDSAGRYSFTNLADGTYRVIAIAANEQRISTPASGRYDVVISGGQTVGSINFGQTDNDQPASASQFGIRILSRLPRSVIGGRKSSVVIRVQNTSKVTFSAPLQLSLFFSASNILDNTAQLAAGPVLGKVVLAKGHSRNYTVHFQYPANLAVGQYFLIGSVIANKSVGQAQAVAVSSVINISPPVVSLTSSIRSKGPLPVKPGRPMTAILTIFNGGNVIANGAATVELFASADGLLDESDTLLKRLTRPIHIAALHSGALRIPFRTPPALPGGSYSLIAKVISDTNPIDANAASDIAVIATRLR